MGVNTYDQNRNIMPTCGNHGVDNSKKSQIVQLLQCARGTVTNAKRLGGDTQALRTCVTVTTMR
jgi:hypothetical protein